MSREEIIRPLIDWYMSGSEDYNEFVKIGTACCDAAYKTGQTTVPTGWKLVPIDPTEKMVCAGDSVAVFNESYESDTYLENTDDVYCAMLAAAPEYKPQSHPVSGDEEQPKQNHEHGNKPEHP